MEIKLSDVTPASPVVKNPDGFELTEMDFKLANVNPAETERFDFESRDKQHHIIALAIFALNEEFSRLDKILPLISWSGHSKEELEGTKTQLRGMEIQVVKLSETFTGFQKNVIDEKGKTTLKQRISLRKKQVMDWKQERKLFQKLKEDVKRVPIAIFTEAWNSSSDHLPLRNLITAISLIFLKKYGHNEDGLLTDEYVEGIWTSEKVKENILKLLPENMSKVSILRVEQFLRAHTQVTYENNNEISKSIAALWPWLRMVVRIAKRVVIEKKTQQKALEERFSMERILQNEKSDKLSIKKHLVKTRKYLADIRKLLKAVEKSLGALPAQLVLHESFTGDSSSIMFFKLSKVPSSEAQKKQAKIDRRRSHEEEQKRVEEENKEINMLASFVGSKFKVSRSSTFSNKSLQCTDEDKKHRPRSKKNRPRSKKNKIPKTTLVGQRTIRELGDKSGTHRNNPRHRRRQGTSRRASRSKR